MARTPKPIGQTRASGWAAARFRSPWWVAGLLLLHVVLLAWVSSRQSVCFDENFHLPAGVRILTRGDFGASHAQPPLTKSLNAVAGLLAGARTPPDSVSGPGFERQVGYSFMRLNEDRYQRVYAAARIPTMALSVALALLIWRVASAWFGPLAGVLSLAAYVMSPESLAHGSVVGDDLATALTVLGASIAFYAFAVAGGWRRWWIAAAWFALAFLVRFSAVQLFPSAALLLLVLRWRAPIRRPREAWLGLAGLAAVAIVAVNAGYLFQGTLSPLSGFEFGSDRFQALQRLAPALRIPFPADYLRGLDYISYLAQPGVKDSYVFGQVTREHVLWYFPLALLVKYPVGLLALAALRVGNGVAASSAPGRRRRRREAVLWVSPLVAFAFATTTSFNFGVRYVLPLLPFLCVGVGALVASQGGRTTAKRQLAGVAAALVLVSGLESARALPYPLSFFNVFAGGPGRGDRIVNDANVDWGQGLIALRDELRQRGIGRVHLAYHGTTDPRLYGIDYVPYLGGQPGPESDYLAISSYYLVGLSARMTTSLGQTEQSVALNMGPLLQVEPIARPAGCLYLFKIR